MCFNVRQKTLKPEWVLHTYSYNTERGCCFTWSWKMLSNRASFTQSLISWYYQYRSVCMETRQWSYIHTVDGHCQVGLFLDNGATRLPDSFCVHLESFLLSFHVYSLLWPVKGAGNVKLISKFWKVTPSKNKECYTVCSSTCIVMADASG